MSDFWTINRWLDENPGQDLKDYFDQAEGMSLDGEFQSVDHILSEPFSVEHCKLCQEYHSLTPEYFSDCPACDLKAEVDEDHLWMLILHMGW
jgi:hypothetical protein